MFVLRFFASRQKQTCSLKVNFHNLLTNLRFVTVHLTDDSDRHRLIVTVLVTERNNIGYLLLKDFIRRLFNS